MDPSTEKGYSAAWVAERVLEAMQRGDQEVKHHSLSCCHLIQFTIGCVSIDLNLVSTAIQRLHISEFEFESKI